MKDGCGHRTIGNTWNLHEHLQYMRERVKKYMLFLGSTMLASGCKTRKYVSDQLVVNE